MLVEKSARTTNAIGHGLTRVFSLKAKVTKNQVVATVGIYAAHEKFTAAQISQN